MAKIKLNGDTSGYIEISAPAVSGNNTLELGPGTRILTNLDNTFTGVSTFSNGIDVSGGNVLVGTTDATIYNNGDSDSEGIVLRNGEVIDVARKGDLQLTLNRQTNDGPHIGFFRSGSPKTYISTRNDAFCIDTGGLNERLRITSDGLVSIPSSGNLQVGGAGSPETDSKVYVANTGGDAYIQVKGADSTGTVGLKFGRNSVANRAGIDWSASTDALSFRTGGTNERLRITSGGLVGVNCTPLSQFQVKSGTNQNIALSSMSSEAAIEAYNDAGSANVPLRLRASAHKFFIGSAERMSINANGYVTKPNQPRFFARRSANYTGYDGRNVGGTWIAFDVLDYNVGGGFQTSGSDQGRFVAPVSGLYLFHATAYKNTGTADWSQSWFDVDGSRANGTDFVHSSATRFAQNAIQVYMTAGQKIGFHPYNNQTNNEIIATGNHTWFKGCLLG